MEDHGDVLDATGRDYLNRVRAAAQRMGELIDDLLQLSRVGRTPLRLEQVDLSALAGAVVAVLQRGAPERTVRVRIAGGLVAQGDPGLLRIMLENLLGNAWKFTGTAAEPLVELGSRHQDGAIVYFVCDNGVGFDMTYMERLFTPFQRLHGQGEFPGTGIGLATVRRIVERHGGRVWAHGEVGNGAEISWTLPGPPLGEGI